MIVFLPLHCLWPDVLTFYCYHTSSTNTHRTETSWTPGSFNGTKVCGGRGFSVKLGDCIKLHRWSSLQMFQCKRLSDRKTNKKSVFNYRCWCFVFHQRYSSFHPDTQSVLFSQSIFISWLFLTTGSGPLEAGFTHKKENMLGKTKIKLLFTL